MQDENQTGNEAAAAESFDIDPQTNVIAKTLADVTKEAAPQNPEWRQVSLRAAVLPNEAIQTQDFEMTEAAAGAPTVTTTLVLHHAEKVSQPSNDKDTVRSTTAMEAGTEPAAQKEPNSDAKTALAIDTAGAFAAPLVAQAKEDDEPSSAVAGQSEEVEIVATVVPKRKERTARSPYEKVDEHLVCKGITPGYAEDSGVLCLWLNEMKTRRNHEKALYYATFLELKDGRGNYKMFDILSDYAKIDKDALQARADDLWNEEGAYEKQWIPGTDQYESRLLARLAVQSISPDFHQKLLRRTVTHPVDGSLWVYNICHHHFDNPSVFASHIKSAINETAIADFEGSGTTDQYLDFLDECYNNLCSVDSAAAHDDIVITIVRQLEKSPIAMVRNKMTTFKTRYCDSDLNIALGEFLSKLEDWRNVLVQIGEWRDDAGEPLPSTANPSSTTSPATRRSGSAGRTSSVASKKRKVIL